MSKNKQSEERRIHIRPGSPAIVVVEDGTELTIDQTDWHFRILDSNGLVLYSRPVVKPRKE